MATAEKNSLDLLRLVAAIFVLYSHQHALLGQPEPLFFGWTTFGGAGVTIFFFLSGMLVWTSWVRDSHWGRFFMRRSLRIFPALWVVVLGTAFVLGPVFSTLSVADYFAAQETWRYLSTAMMLIRHTLPGVFSDNPFPQAVNGSLWTLPVEFLCYVSVAVLGSVKFMPKGIAVALCLLLTVLLASFAPLITGVRFSLHFEMVAMFWMGAMYGFCRQRLRDTGPTAWLTLAIGLAALLAFLVLGPRGTERTAMLVAAAALVHLALRVPAGAKLTDRMGDLSYGVYIVAFPVQQIVAHCGQGRGWSFESSLALSLVATGGLALVSWHLVEKQALRFKPQGRAAS